MYRNPALTVDALVSKLTFDGKRQILLIQRGKEPFKGSWAFPGGFVDYGEDPKVAVARELLEETHLVACGEPILVTVEGNPKRDPRQHTVTIAYSLEVNPESLGKLKGDDDAADARWFSLDSVVKGEVKMAFDHLDIANVYSKWLKETSSQH